MNLIKKVEKMSRILVYKTIDIKNKSNYKTMANTFYERFGGVCPNFGNKLWYQGIISEVSTEDNEIIYYTDSFTTDYINNNFDILLYPMANIFSIEFSKGLIPITSFIKNLKIPVYIISCGVQANNYDDLENLVYTIGNVSKEFIKAVYNSGGDFALRGYFTAEFFKRLGFNDLNVVGCPSIFQCGPSIKITKKDVLFKDFKVAVNGKAEIALPVLKEYKSIFYDQEQLFNILYNNIFYSSVNAGIKGNIQWLKSSGFGFYFNDLILNDRIRLLADMWDWQHSLQNEGVCFSFGTRIHGNVMSILSGIPALIVNVDMRVKEMAEFYDIPNIEYSDVVNNLDTKNYIYKLYKKLDYTTFNKKFLEKYNAFNDFMVKKGIVKKLNTNNPYLNCSDGCYPKSAIVNAKKRANLIKKHKTMYSLLLKY